MCGRFGLEAPWQELFEYFDLIRPQTMGEEMPPRHNIAPSQPIVTISPGADGQREGRLVRWGLVPAWVKDPKEFTLLVNARSETAIEKPSFRNAMRHRRVLIPASGFYEWQRFGKGQPSQAYWVRPNSGGIVAFGGLMETWSDPNGSEIDTGCVLTTGSNTSFSEIHHRMPVVIQPQDFERWLDVKNQEPRDVLDLMKPVNDNYFESIPVSNAVNKVSNTGRDIQNRVEAAGPAKSKQDDNEQFSMF
ncbi:MAG: SOS response-associated peptidase [Rhizobiaceae bacterium]|nr:SOS response-associated peptidase [Rhizobiaceae bacterium]